MTILALSLAGGLIWGNLFKLILAPNQWRLIFLIEAGIMGFFSIFFACFSSNYCDKSIFFGKHEQGVDEQGIARDDIGMVSIFDMNDHKPQDAKHTNENNPSLSFSNATNKGNDQRVYTT